MAARRLRVRIPTHHSGEFRLALRPRHLSDARCAVVFLDDEVLVPEGGDLRQVGDDDDLPAGSEPLEPRPHLGRRLPADAGVDLVENKGGGGLGAPQHELEGEHDAGQLAAGGSLTKRASGGVRMRLETENDRFASVRTWLRCLQVDVKSRVGHRQGMQLVVDSSRELAGQAGAALRQACADVKNAALRLCELALDHSGVRGRGRQLLHAPARQVCPRQQGLDVAGAAA